MREHQNHDKTMDRTMLDNLIIDIVIGEQAMIDRLQELIKNPLAAKGAIQELNEAIKQKKKVNGIQAFKIRNFIKQLEKQLNKTKL